VDVLGVKLGYELGLAVVGLVDGSDVLGDELGLAVVGLVGSTAVSVPVVN
jgi:hypothetical protein